MIKFTKYHGLGNDFIIIDGREENEENYSKLAKSICDRNFGIGADGLIIVKESDKQDIKMKIFNTDGSEAPMCGNGIRCFSKYVFDNNIIDKKGFSVETLAGSIQIEMIRNEFKVSEVRANMGKAHFKGKGIPIGDERGFINKEIVIKDKPLLISTVDLGNIHSVIFVDDLDTTNVEVLGPIIENHDLFPNKTNVNFCEIIDKKNIKLITWERGVGKTLACGTGASASAVISNLFYGTEKKVTVDLLGGKVEIDITGDEVFMTGPAEIICDGKFYLTN